MVRGLREKKQVNLQGFRGVIAISSADKNKAGKARRWTCKEQRICTMMTMVDMSLREGRGGKEGVGASPIARFLL